MKSKIFLYLGYSSNRWTGVVDPTAHEQNNHTLWASRDPLEMYDTLVSQIMLKFTCFHGVLFLFFLFGTIYSVFIPFDITLRTIKVIF
jgi:hypothetical protein